MQCDCYNVVINNAGVQADQPVCLARIAENIWKPWYTSTTEPNAVSLKVR